MKQRMLSGIKPSGSLTLGNYIGALSQFVKYQDDYDLYVFIANLHCITVPQDPKELNKNLRDAIALYLACGLDPNKCNIFLQTDIMEQAQLGFIVNCHTYMGELNRMTQYKDKVAKGEKNLSGGIYTYPALMAADILAYQANYVPVGEDQKQHVELCRDVAIRMNNRYNQELFTIPEPLVTKVGARIMNLQDPTKKMSKSEDSDKGCILLLDTPSKARKKIMSAVTDSIGIVQYDPENQPGIANLLQIGAVLSNRSIEDIANEYRDGGYGTFKKYIASLVEETLTTIQEKYNHFNQTDILTDVLAKGKANAQVIASETLRNVQKAIGLEID